ncbi:MAG: ATP-dependent metallopeptidase FtsH/Yme1/Tma family protein [Elusimicrobia bacterium]|nr:ATP-dependent metallopeptidase FtsH/Yme1/Tma family protein [Elusimicrobiota bacterium]
MTPTPPPPGPKAYRFHTAYFLLAAFAVAMIHDVWTQLRAVDVLPYSEFQKLLEEKKIKSVVVGQDTISGQFNTPPSGGKPYFTTVRVDLELAKQLERYGVEFSRRPQSRVLEAVLSWLMPAFAFLLVWMWLMRRMGERMDAGGLMTIGKSKAKVYVEKDTKTTFRDVAGVDEAVDELKEIVDFLKNPKEYGRLGGRMPKGVLLVGPPGTGKTLLAKAVAGEAGVAFFSINGPEFVEMFVGVGAARVRDLFEQARKTAPCIIFIDELDALGRARGAYPFAGGHDEKEQTLNQLLVELDGFDSRVGLVILAATNRPEILDPALLRAGRFDRQVLVDRPDKIGRAAILAIYFRKVSLEPDVDAGKIAALAPGFTGADLANLVNEAALAATRRKASRVGMEDFNSAIERIVAGLEKKNRLLNPMERDIVAHHEMGHALVAAALPGVDPVHKVSIIPRGIGALGYTIQRPLEDRFLMTREELENKMAVLLGGRAAEQLVFGRLSTGAHDDLGKVTEIARHMATSYGMAAGLGHVTYDREPSAFLGTAGPEFRRYSEATAARIDSAVRDTVDAAFQTASAVLEENKAVLLQSARTLLAKETLTEAELAPIFKSLRALKRPAG